MNMISVHGQICNDSRHKLIVSAAKIIALDGIAVWLKCKLKSSLSCWTRLESYGMNAEFGRNSHQLINSPLIILYILYTFPGATKSKRISGRCQDDMQPVEQSKQRRKRQARQACHLSSW